MVVGGYHAAGDGAGGLFYWDSTSTADANGGTVIAPSLGHNIGRWTRIYSGPLSVRWFGAKGDLSVDDGPAIRAAYAAAVAANVPLHIPGSQIRPAAAGGPAANLGYLIKPPADEPPPAGQLPGVGLNLADPGIPAHPKLGDLAVASFSQPLPQGVTISAAVVSDDHVRVTLVNNSGAPAPVPTGYIRVGVFVM